MNFDFSSIDSPRDRLGIYDIRENQLTLLPINSDIITPSRNRLTSDPKDI